MATVHKPTFTIPIPSDARIVEKDGRRFARFKYKGDAINAPLTRDGKKCRVKTDCWYVRYKDLDGKWKREKGYTDKRATEEMARKIQERLDQRQEGVNPFKEHHERLLAGHLADWKENLLARGVSSPEVMRITNRVRAVFDACGFRFIPDMCSVDVDAYLGRRRNASEKPMAAQTHNFYVQAIRRFCKWLVDKGRTDRDRLADIAMMKITEDRRIHTRRALTAEEFTMLIEAAADGPMRQGISGPDRAMLYILAGWTGYRRGELASLTLRSFDLDGPTPAVSVPAGYTKNKRAAVIPLHPVVIQRLRAWLETKEDMPPDAPLFVLKTYGGHWKRTADMMRDDLAVARAAWLKEASTPEERSKREASDLLCYQDEDGLFADFHANRHTFITNLGRVGVPLATAQRLARHSDPRLTSNIYTHLEVYDQATAIRSLPAPPPASTGPKSSILTGGGYHRFCVFRSRAVS